MLPLLQSVLLCGLAVFQASAQTVEQALVIKGSMSMQTSPGAPVLNPRNLGPGYGGPWFFYVSVAGPDIGSITPPVITLPPASLYPTQNQFRHNNGILFYNPGLLEWNYGVEGNGYGTQTEAALNASFAFGSYGLSVLGESFTLNFPSTPFPPNVPQVTLTGGNWSGGKYVIDVSQPLTITTSAFTNFGQNADGVIELHVDGAPDSVNRLVFNSDSPGAPNFVTSTIPPHTLVAGQDYDAGAAFYAVTDKRLPNPSRLDAAAYERSMFFKIAAVAPPQPDVVAKFHGVGDLYGGFSFSEVRDATKVGSVIRAVGDSNSQGVEQGGDTGFFWTSGNGLRPLRDLDINFSGTNFSQIAATAITPDGAFIASRARFGSGGTSRHAVRVTSVGLVNLDLGALPGFTNSQAHSISNDGSVLYGIANYTNAPTVPVRTRAVRFTASGPSVTVIPFLNPGDDTSAPADRGTSADGSVMVGRSTNGTVDLSPASPGGNGIGAGNQAFRYVHGVGVSPIPFIAGGTWSGAVAVSPDGNLTLVRGDSVSAPQGEFYLHNAASGTLTSLGTPNGSRRPGGIVGMTADGAVVATSFNARDNPVNATVIGNAHGWHDFQSIVERAGVDLSGWNLRHETIFGLSPDGTLVWGRGVHNGNREGFIVEFPAGHLANVKEPDIYSAPDASIVGSWVVEGGVNAAITFFSNGYYMMVETAAPADGPAGISGFERGQYKWDTVTGVVMMRTLLDTNGDHGTSDGSDIVDRTITISGNTMTVTGVEDNIILQRVRTSDPFVGSWGDATTANDSTNAIFLPNGYYFLARDGDSTAEPTGRDGMEWGTYSWNAATGAFTVAPAVDTNGEWGFSHPDGPQTFTLSSDLLTLIGNGGQFALSRVGAAPAVVTLGNLNQSHDGTPKSVSVTTSPNVAVSVMYDGSPTPPSALGSYAVVATVTDPNYFGGASGTLTIGDTTAPVITQLTASPASLWPVNQKMVAVTLTASVSDAIGVASVAIVSVTSSEPDNGLGDGDTANDIIITGPMTLNLRAERAGNGPGRTYTITVEARDAAGNASARTVTVLVPKSQSGK